MKPFSLTFFVLLGIGYVTLLERFIIRTVQLRRGPKEVGYLGLAQPFRDALKLFRKEVFPPVKSLSFVFWVAPSLGVFLSLAL